MNAFIRNTVSFFLTILSAPAWSFGEPSESTGRGGVTDRISSVVYKFVEANNVRVISLTAEPVANMSPSEQRSGNPRIFRVDNRVASGTTKNTFLENDSALFSMNTSGRAMNNTLSFIGTVRQDPWSNATTKWLQVLSMLATRKADFQMAYAARLSANSRIESNIDCRYFENGVSKLAVVARIQYRFDF